MRNAGSSGCSPRARDRVTASGSQRWGNGSSLLLQRPIVFCTVTMGFLAKRTATLFEVTYEHVEQACSRAAWSGEDVRTFDRDEEKQDYRFLK